MHVDIIIHDNMISGTYLNDTCTVHICTSTCTILGFSLIVLSLFLTQLYLLSLQLYFFAAVCTLLDQQLRTPSHPICRDGLTPVLQRADGLPIIII